LNASSVIDYQILFFYHFFIKSIASSSCSDGFSLVSNSTALLHPESSHCIDSRAIENTILVVFMNPDFKPEYSINVLNDRRGFSFIDFRPS